VFDGHISGEGELHIEGSVRGDIQVARVTIGERAQVEGTVRGSVVEVRGRVVGNVEGKAVKLYESAHVEGDITHEQLSIEVGAFFEGRCSQLRPPPQVHQPAPKPAAAAPQPAPQPSPPAATAPNASARLIELDKSMG
jgi:cytoskeletal protein CcmA (bactofilin family)